MVNKQELFQGTLLLDSRKTPFYVESVIWDGKCHHVNLTTVYAYSRHQLPLISFQDCNTFNSFAPIGSFYISSLRTLGNYGYVLANRKQTKDVLCVVIKYIIEQVCWNHPLTKDAFRLRVHDLKYCTFLLRVIENIVNAYLKREKLCELHLKRVLNPNFVVEYAEHDEMNPVHNYLVKSSVGLTGCPVGFMMTPSHVQMLSKRGVKISYEQS